LSGCPIVVVAEDLPTSAVVQIVRAGAADVIGLPAPPEDIVAQAVLQLGVQPEGTGADVLESHSPTFRHLAGEIRSVAPLRSTVLLTGETGTGKGLLARTIHELSDRSDRPFVHVDCAALSPTVIESELFGHRRGSFTGAVESRPGRFELAADGTIFLDEIGELAPSLQAKLLRILEDREFERIGSTRTQVMTARVIAATSRDLRQAVEKGWFRADLFFRLEVFHLRVPPLRDRLEDLPLLVRRGIERLARQLDLPVPSVTDTFCERLQRHLWPGNVRELMNVLERVMVRACSSVLDADALADLLTTKQTVSTGIVEDSERDAIVRVLEAVGGNVSRAARRLGVPRTTLRYRLRQLDLEHLVPRD
jgi:transcriptional regulator with GAF, ATPase, and Fis domain